MTPVTASSFPVVIQFRALWQPHIHITLSEMDWAILNNCASRRQADLRQRRDPIGFSPQDLVAVRCNPSTPPQRYWVRRAITTDPVRANPVWLIAPLAEMHLPPKGPIPPRKSLTRHFKGSRVVWMEYQNERWQSVCCHSVRKILPRTMSATIFLHTQVARPDFFHRNHVVELPHF